jgi:hypothetical protein
MRTLLPLLAVAALIAPAAAAPKASPDAQLAKLLDGRVAGKPASCISLTRMNQGSQIVDRKAIVYRDGRTLWVNQPRGGASSLRSDDILLTRSWGGQLCRSDSVRLIDRVSSFPRGFVMLDDFVPYRLPDKAERRS